MNEKPKVVCLCGSTRFSEAFQHANLTETLAGRIVLTIGCDFKSDDALGLTDADKKQLDELHKHKIDLADEVMVLNVDGYVGDSAASEIEYAMNLLRPIRWLEPDRIPASYSLIDFEKKYVAIAKQEIEEREKAGFPVTLEWLDALERKHRALALQEIAALESGK